MCNQSYTHKRFLLLVVVVIYQLLITSHLFLCLRLPYKDSSAPTVEDIYLPSLTSASNCCHYSLSASALNRCRDSQPPCRYTPMHTTGQEQLKERRSHHRWWYVAEQLRVRRRRQTRICIDCWQTICEILRSMIIYKWLIFMQSLWANILLNYMPSQDTYIVLAVIFFKKRESSI
jgi:hypothetical protein